MDRVQMGMIALAVLLLVFWFTTLPESPTPEPGTPIAEPMCHRGTEDGGGGTEGAKGYYLR